MRPRGHTVRGQRQGQMQRGQGRGHNFWPRGTGHFEDLTSLQNGAVILKYVSGNSDLIQSTILTTAMLEIYSETQRRKLTCDCKLLCVCVCVCGIIHKSK